MQIGQRSLEASDTAPRWCDPIAMFIAWLARLFDQIAKMKRIRHNTKFKANWRDNYPGLVQCEWIRDQILAAGAARLLAGKSLDEDDGFIPSTEPPANYGGPCPKTPQQMNRRFLAVARFNADPVAAIRKHAARIAKREQIALSDPLRPAQARDTSPGYAGGGNAPAPLASLSRPATGGGVMRVLHAHDGGGLTFARGPPHPLQTQNHPPRSHLRERTRAPIPPNRTSRRPTSSAPTRTQHP